MPAYFRYYPEYHFHYLQYERLEYLDLGMDSADRVHESTDYVAELLFSLANLHVASEADGFIGELCTVW